VPGAYYFLMVVNGGKVEPWHLLVITCIPGTIIVDNAHF